MSDMEYSHTDTVQFKTNTNVSCTCMKIISHTKFKGKVPRMQELVAPMCLFL